MRWLPTFERCSWWDNPIDPSARDCGHVRTYETWEGRAWSISWGSFTVQLRIGRRYLVRP